MSRRIGRWVYDDQDFRYGNAGWHLDGSPLVLDFMPGMTDCEPGRGMYLLYNWPGQPAGDHMISTHLRPAMREVEAMWDKHLQAEAGAGSVSSRSWSLHESADR